MNYSEKIDTLWSFKNGRSVTSNKPSLEMSIWVGTPNITHHQVAYKILETMGQNPSTALGWSRNWGLTRVYIGFDEILKSSFSLKKQTNIKLSTTKLIKPEALLSNYENKGGYKIVLNNEAITFEGFVIQIQRMVDELVLSIFNKNRKNSLKSDDDLYLESVYSVLNCGIEFLYDSAENIVNSFSVESGVFVRLYGNVNGLGKVPKVIGSVNTTVYHYSSEETNLIRLICSKNSAETIYRHQIEINLPRKDLVVICGISSIKRPHVGHYLMLCFSDYIRGHFNNASISIEANDYGPRIIGTIATTSLRLKKSVTETLNYYFSPNVSASEIERDYLNRLSQGRVYDEVKEKVANNFLLNIPSLYTYLEEMVLTTGFSSAKITKNTTSIAYLLLGQVFKAVSLWSDFGLEYLDFGGRILLTKYEDIYTADYCRLATIMSQNSRCIYVDCGESISRTKNTAFKNDGRLQTRGGCYIGFRSQISSSTSGNVVDIQTFLDYLQSDDAEEAKRITKFYILTHEETAIISDDREVTETFFDYASPDALKADCEISKIEKNEISSKIERILKNLESKSFYQKGDSQETATIIRNLEKAVKESDFSKLFPKPKKVIPNPEFRIALTLYEKICIKKQNLLGSLVQVLFDGVSVAKNITDILVSSGIINPTTNQFLNSENDIGFNYVKILKARGYTASEVKVLACDYFYGKKLFYRKRSITFETLLCFVKCFDTFEVSDNNRQEMLTLLKLLLSRIDIF